MKLSIIVPVYNVEDFLVDCIQSICDQVYKNFELILVDDGSIDNSGAICDEYALKDSRIKVIHQHNKGRVVARCVGVKHAKGEWIGFVDSDDWIEPEMYENLIKMTDFYKVDLVLSGKKKGNTFGMDVYPEGLYDSPEKLSYILKNALYCFEKNGMGINGSMCDKIFKKELLLPLLEDIPAQLYMHEDILLVIKYLTKCKSIYETGKCWYNYRPAANIDSHNYHPDFMHQLYIFDNALRTFIKGNIYEEIVLKGLDQLLLNSFLGEWVRSRKSKTTYIPRYFLDSQLLELDIKKCVIYGAGAVGKDYLYILKKLYNLSPCLWIDKAYEEYSDGVDVKPIDILKTASFQKIIIAVNNKSTAEQIRLELQERFNIISEKIIWKKPVNLYAII